jgi:Tfp pilus assembly protein PilO
VSKQSNPKTLGLMAFVVLALGGGATYFQFNAVQAAKADVDALEGQVPSQKELEKSLADSQFKLVEYQTKLSHLEGSVPDVAYIPTLMKELELIGTADGIKVTGVRPAPVVVAPSVATEGKRKEKKDYSEVEIEVKGRGRYDSIKTFLDSLQKFPKVIAVKTVSLTPMRDGNAGGSNNIDVVINVVAYVFPFEVLTAADPSKTAAPANTEAPAGGPVVTEGDATIQQTTIPMNGAHRMAKPRGGK